MAGFTADAALADTVAWNTVAQEASLFELRAEHAPEDGFIRSCSQGRKSRGCHEALLVCAVQQSNFHKG